MNDVYILARGQDIEFMQQQSSSQTLFDYDWSGKCL